ncbi:MAG: hypothetical protein ACI90V_009829, partial [Bacillariaceae sp.]
MEPLSESKQPAVQGQMERQLEDCSHEDDEDRLMY